MLDNENARQQEALGIIGVNFIYGAFNLYQNPEALIGTLLDHLTWERVEVDMIQFGGPAFARVDNRLMALQLVQQGLTEAAMFTARGEAIQWSEVFYKKPVLVQRGSFHPITNATLDVLERAQEQFAQSPRIQGEEPVVLMEMTLRHLRMGEFIDEKDFLARADTLSVLGKTVLISNFLRFHRLAGYLAGYTNRPIALALGASKLKEIFDESLYNNSEGGIFGGLGQPGNRAGPETHDGAELGAEFEKELRAALCLSQSEFRDRRTGHGGNLPRRAAAQTRLRVPAGKSFHRGNPQLQQGRRADPLARHPGSDPGRRCLLAKTRPPARGRNHPARRIVRLRQVVTPTRNTDRRPAGQTPPSAGQSLKRGAHIERAHAHEAKQFARVLVAAGGRIPPSAIGGHGNCATIKLRRRK